MAGIVSTITDRQRRGGEGRGGREHGNKVGCSRRERKGGREGKEEREGRRGGRRE